MILKRIQAVSFLLLLLAVFILVVLIIKPFIIMLAFAVILAILFYPIHARLLLRFKSPSLAALITVFILLLIIAIPVFFFGNLVWNEVINLYHRVSQGGLVLRQDELVANLPANTRVLIENFSANLNAALARITGDAFQTLSSAISNVAGFLTSLIILFLSMFFLLRDGERIKKILIELSPIAQSQENILIDRIIKAVNGVIKGAFSVALVHGAVATVGFLVFGVSEPLLWGMFMVVAALIPFVGTIGTVTAAVVFLAITGHGTGAIGLAIWGAVTIPSIDNFIAPRMWSARTNLHPLLVLLGILGGLHFFGALGFLIGPVILAIFVALIDIYRSDFKQYIE